MQGRSQHSSKATLIAAVLNQRRLNTAQRQTAERSLESLIDVLVDYHIRYGNKFGADLRTLANETGLNHKAVTKWLNRLRETPNLIRESQGHYKEHSSTWSLGGTLLNIAASSMQHDSLSNTHLGTHNHNTAHENIQATYSSDTIHESFFDYGVDVLDKLSCSIEDTAKVTGSVPPTKLTRLLDDLPDIVDTEPYQPVPDKHMMALRTPVSEEQVKQYERKQRAKKLLANSRLGQAFVNGLWRQCEKEKSNGGQYQYPIHPTIYSILIDCDERLERFRAKNAELIANVAPSETFDAEEQIRREYANDRINDICFDNGRLRPELRWLYQPPKETRKQCPKCTHNGRHRTLRLLMLTSYRFGAIKLHCNLCNGVWDLWRDYPVWGR